MLQKWKCPKLKQGRRSMKKRIISLVLIAGLMIGTWDMAALAEEVQPKTQKTEALEEEIIEEDMQVLSQNAAAERTSAVPTISAVSVEPKDNLTAPGEIEVSVTVKDPAGNGVNSISIDFKGPGGKSAAACFFETGTQYPGKEGQTYTQTVTLSKYLPKGMYQLSFITLVCPNGDVQYTPQEDCMVGSANGIRVDSFPIGDSSFTITSSLDGDDTPPAITNVAIENKVWEAPGKIKIDVHVVEEGSGVESIQFAYKEEKTGFNLSLNASAAEGNLRKLSSDHYVMEAELPENAPTGNYVLSFALVTDKAGYDTQYGNISFGYDLLQVKNITGVEYDYTVPILKYISAEKKTLKAPSLVKLSMKIETKSDISQIYLYYVGTDGNRLDIRTNERETYSGNKENEVYLPINQYAQSGKYELNAILIINSAGNVSTYNSEVRNQEKGFVRYEDGIEKDFVACDGAADITVENGTAVDVRTGLGDRSLADRLRNMKEGGTAVVTAREVTVVPKAAFEAIKGKNKTLVLEAEGIQWIFNGKDLNSKLKDIDVQVMIDTVTEQDSVLYGLPKDGYKMSFQPNGQLPGPAKIRVNLGYEFYVRGLSGNIVLSWLNEVTSKLEQVNSKVNYGQDSYAEFVLSHNSIYFLSSGYKQQHVHSYAKNIKKATTKRNGSIQEKCRTCGAVKKSTPIYYPKKITLKTGLTFNGKVQKPSVTVKGSNGKTIKSSNYKVSYSSGCKKIGHYKATIKFKGNYTGTVVKKFTINPKGTKLSSVKAAKKKAVVKWKKQTKNTKGYQIQYSTKKNFKSGLKTKTVKGNKKTSLTLKGLKSKKTYYVRVRTYQDVKGGKCYSAWSKAKKVKVK